MLVVVEVIEVLLVPPARRLQQQLRAADAAEQPDGRGLQPAQQPRLTVRDERGRGCDAGGRGGEIAGCLSSLVSRLSVGRLSAVGCLSPRSLT